MIGEQAKSHYMESVERSIHAIVELGDLFEINYTERLCADVGVEPFDFYMKMRGVSTGNYMAYLDTGDGWQLASVSPEQFISCQDRHLVTRPIKGTCRRDEHDPVRDKELAETLMASAKDRAENIMIVDLMRNDLTQVCELGSVQATELCGLESFAGVHHLVSTVEGTLAEGLNAMDALLASFPAGSITGAPKLRSMEYIHELELSARGPYTGSMFYVSSCGQMDSSVLIRTAELCDGKALYGAGGAIVSHSDAELEWNEALLKARPFFGALSDDK